MAAVSPDGVVSAAAPAQQRQKWWFFAAGALAVAIGIVVAIAVIPGNDGSTTAGTSSMRTVTTSGTRGSTPHSTSERSTSQRQTTVPVVPNVDPNAVPGYFLNTDQVARRWAPAAWSPKPSPTI